MHIIYHSWRVPNMDTSTRMHEYYSSSLTSSKHEHKHTYTWILFIILDEFLTWTKAYVCMNIIYHSWRVPTMNTSTRMLEYYLTSWRVPNMNTSTRMHEYYLSSLAASSYHEHKHTYARILFIILDEFLTWTQAHVCVNIMYHPWRFPNMNKSTRMHEYYLSSLTSS